MLALAKPRLFTAEPEIVVVGEVDGRQLAFVGLERVGGVVIFDISDPAAPVFDQYVRTRDFTASPPGPDSGPEGMAFVSADSSPTGAPMLLVGNEVSGTSAGCGCQAVMSRRAKTAAATT